MSWGPGFYMWGHPYYPLVEMRTELVSTQEIPEYGEDYREYYQWPAYDQIEEEERARNLQHGQRDEESAADIGLTHKHDLYTIMTASFALEYTLRVARRNLWRRERDDYFGR